jgi:hypothetical protein
MRLVGNTEKWLMKVKMLDPLRLARSQQKMFFWSNGRCNKLQTQLLQVLFVFVFILVSPNLLIYDSLRLPFGTIHS